MATPTVFEVQLSDGRNMSATVKVADLIAFERQYDKSVSDIGNRIEYSTFIAWAALKRQGDLNVEFEDFLPLVEVTTDSEIESPKGS